MSFSIGQKVVCIETHPQNMVIAGDIYTIKGLHDCPHCGAQFVDVGIEVPASGVFCTSCMNGVKTGGVWFLFAYRFRPLDPLEEQLDRIEIEGNQFLKEAQEPLISQPQ